MIIAQKVLRNVSLTAHPQGCAEYVCQQVEWVKRQVAQHMDNRYANPNPSAFPKRVLVVGGSTGYGLSSRIVAAIVGKAGTINVSFEREPTEHKTATPGWYNTIAFERIARKNNVFAASVFGDAYAHAVKESAAAMIKKEFGSIDLLVYSLASPLRVDEKTNRTYRSVIKPIETAYEALSVDVSTGMISRTVVEPAEDSQVEETVKVMGGEDWQQWISYLQQEQLLSEGFKTVAFSYIGPELTYPIYRNGTIGKAKEHLEQTAIQLTSDLSSVRGQAFVAVNKAIVTRASAVIPVVPLYIALLYRVMKDKGLHEDCTQQMYRLFSERLYGVGNVPVDSQGRIRVDDWEMSAEVQQAVSRLWDNQHEGSLITGGDLDGFIQDYANIHGFGYDSIDYSADVDPRIVEE
ncbi:MAG: enoyl-ACP reductase FabV [Sphaerochaetaceae bacterium]